LAGRSATAKAQVNGDDTSVTDYFIGLPGASVNALAAGTTSWRALMDPRMDEA
jgi:hypothetical protein